MRKAEDDYRTARKLARGHERLDDQLCFHCQQSAEKYVKAIMQEVGLPIPRIHDVHALLKMLPAHVDIRGLGRGGVFLRQFAVTTRYPGEDATPRQARAALRWARRFRAVARKFLGL
ncbi:MAG: HEPN domain-containing protein [Planctomycetes bacterium]|nr:HEPN domain-containing protein [Planctomycetota bacterium]